MVLDSAAAPDTAGTGGKVHSCVWNGERNGDGRVPR